MTTTPTTSESDGTGATAGGPAVSAQSRATTGAGVPSWTEPDASPSAPSRPSQVGLVVPLCVQDRLVLDMARAGRDATLHLGAVLTFDSAPTRSEVLRQITERLPAAPELAVRLGQAGRRPAWVSDDRFDPARHVHEIRLPIGFRADADGAMAAVLEQPLLNDRPLWGLWLVRGGGHTALCYRAHHAYQDGLAMVETLELLFGPPPESGTRTVVPAQAPTRGGVRDAAGVWRDLLTRRHRPVHWTALDRPRTGRRRAYTTTAELARLHRLGRVLRTSTSQLCLTVLTGALRSWHPGDWHAGDSRVHVRCPDDRQSTGLRLGAASDGAGRTDVGGRSPGAQDALRALYSINVREASDPYRLLGNRGAMTPISLPCGEPDPLRHAELVREHAAYPRMAAVGRRHRVLYRHLPYWCGRLGLGRDTDPRGVPLTVADLRVRRPLEVGGHPVVGAFPIPVTVPGQPLFAAWFCHNGRLQLTFLADRALTEVRDLPGLWHTALEELEDAAGLRAR